MTQRGLASRLNRRVSIEFPTRVPNGQGGYTKGWSAPVPVWAEMIPLRGQEAVKHNLSTSAQLWKVTIRFRTDVNSDCRLMLAGAALNIRTCEDPDGRRRELVMTAESGTKT